MNTHRMSCGEAREKLPLYVGGDLDSDVLDAVREHLDTCDDCARRATEATRARRELVGALRSRDGNLGRPDLWMGIRATLRAEGLVHDARPPVALPAGPVRARRARWTWALVPATAAAVLLALLQISGVLAPGSGKQSNEFVAPHPFGGAPEGALEGVAELVVAPVAAPSLGGLRRVDPRDPILRPARYQSLRLNEGSAPVPNDISLTGLNGFK